MPKSKTRSRSLGPRSKAKGKRYRAGRRGVTPARTAKVRLRRLKRTAIETPETAARVDRVSELAEQVFGDKAKAARWLDKPKVQLSGKSPLKYLADEHGERVVKDMLYRIDAGILP